MAVHEAALEAMREAQIHVPDVIRTFMRIRDVTQEALGDALGLTQTQVSRRLNVPGALTSGELAAVAAYFGVSPATFYKPTNEAIADLLSRDSSCSSVLAGASALSAA